MTRLLPRAICAAAAALLSGPAFATPPAAQPASEANSSEVVCRRLPPDAGTIMSRRACKTRAQWAADAAAAQRRVIQREGRSALGRTDGD
jgi:hypothetical protein